MDERYKTLQAKQVRNIEGYNRAVDPEERLPYWVVVVDELADLMMVSAGEVQTSLVRLAQIARAVGIHLIIATQRPSVDVVTGLIKANFPTRIAFQVASKVDSRTVLDGNGAEQLLGRGDMIFVPPGANKQMRVHGAWVADDEVKGVCEFLRKQGTAVYEEVVLPSDDEAAEGDGGADRDDLYWDCRAPRHRPAPGVDLVPAAPHEPRLSEGRALHRHDGAGPDHRPGRGRQAARGPGRARSTWPSAGSSAGPRALAKIATAAPDAAAGQIALEAKIGDPRSLVRGFRGDVRLIRDGDGGKPVA